MRELTTVIVNYDSADFLERCLASIRRETHLEGHQVVVIDNGSREPLPGALQARFPEVEFLANSANLGFSKACNQGLRAFPARHYLLLNPDTEVLEGAIDRTLGFLKSRPDAGVVGCRVLNPDGTLQKASRRAIPVPAAAFFRLSGLSRLFPGHPRLARYNLAHLDPRQTAEVEAVSGSFMMFPHDLLESIGGLDERFFLYGEDLDFCYRALGQGRRNYFFAGAQVLHYKRRSSSRDRAAANFHYHDAMRIFYRKHFREESGVLLDCLVLAGIRLLYWGSELRRRLGMSGGVGSAD